MSRPYGSPNVDDRPLPRTPNGRVKMVGNVDHEVHARAKAAAYAGGMTIGVYLASLILRDELDESGRPVWAASATNGTQELPDMQAATAA